ncbi:transcriptional repressor [Candidatus Saccharibacteria bacterium]|nr:transcriptional repressor [Candidatus Saccharibacteria bacterium]
MKRNTVQKQLVLDAINALADHPTAEQIYQYVIKSHPTISRATVYRNLAGLEASSEISEVGVINGATHFDHNTHDHFHFVCDTCQCLIDIPSFDLEKHLAPHSDLMIKKINLTLRGTCPDCQ